MTWVDPYAYLKKLSDEKLWGELWDQDFQDSYRERQKVMEEIEERFWKHAGQPMPEYGVDGT